MKKQMRLTALFIALFIACAFLAACSPAAAGGKSGLCRIVIARGDNYYCADDVKQVKAGESVTFRLEIDNGYTYGGVNYADSTANVAAPDGNGTRRVDLTLNNVQYSEYLEIRLTEVQKIYRVSVKNSPHFTCAEPEIYVEEHATAEFSLIFDGAYTASQTDYDGNYRLTGTNAVPDGNGKRAVTLRLSDVCSSAEVEVITQSYSADVLLYPVFGRAVAGYMLNGGKFIDGLSSDLFYTENYTARHSRPNLALGTDVIEREGYILTGWNTLPDGGGEHIGLGSRYAIAMNDVKMFYAEWEKCDDDGKFTYVTVPADAVEEIYESKDKAEAIERLSRGQAEEECCAVITGYSGQTDKMVIPEYLDGYPVGVVAPRFHVSDSRLNTVIFPKTARYIADRAFANCRNLRTVYLYDNLEHIDGTAFGREEQIKTLHINAVVPPVFGKEANGQFANKMEMLISQNPDSRKMIFFGSCSLWYGLDNETVYNLCYGKAQPCNMGIIGGTCALYQLDLILQYIKSDDIFIDVIEIGSPWQVLADLSFDGRVYTTVENNYDLVASLDLTRYTNVIDALDEFFSMKNDLLYQGKSGSYDDYYRYMGEFGCLSMDRRGDYDNLGAMYEFCPAETITGSGAFGRLKDLFDKVAEKGAQAYFTFGPLNREGVDMQTVEELDRLFAEQFASNGICATVISSQSANVMENSYFYDTNYHLSTKGAREWSKNFAAEFRKAVEF